MPDSLQSEYARELANPEPALEELLSRPLDRREYVQLRPSPGAQLLDAHSGLRLEPTVRDPAPHSPEIMVERLGAVVTGAGAGAGPALQRFVEPGVGRSCIAMDLYFADQETPTGWPHRPDFLLTGIGLTPYSARGFVNIGRMLDGRLSLIRARHRTTCARLLADLGCHTSLSVATLSLAQPPIEMPDGTQSSAVILCRAFRSLVRVKQLDPIACVLHSPRHGLTALNYVLAAAMPPGLAGTDRVLFACAMAIAFDRYAPSQDDVPFLLNDNAAAGAASIVRRIRLNTICETAPALIRRTMKTLAIPLASASATDGELGPYSRWFAAELGRQLGVFKKNRFLHDYHYPGIRRQGPWVYSLVEHNVTLACEFADLETGLFVDCDDDYLRQHLQLAPIEIATVRSNFATLHARDVAAAWRVAATVQAIAQLVAPGSAPEDHYEMFTQSYRRAAT
jgi:hypothetical protein